VALSCQRIFLCSCLAVIAAELVDGDFKLYTHIEVLAMACAWIRAVRSMD